MYRDVFRLKMPDFLAQAEKTTSFSAF